MSRERRDETWRWLFINILFKIVHVKRIVLMVVTIAKTLFAVVR